MMNRVLVDTCVWSEVLRRKNPNPEIQKAMRELLLDLHIIIIGPVRQEVLSGVKANAQFEKLQALLAILPDEEILPEDYVQAARFCNTCRARGVQGSPVDFLLCAVAYRLDVPIFSVDQDFQHYIEHIPVRLYEVE